MLKGGSISIVVGDCAPREIISCICAKSIRGVYFYVREKYNTTGALNNLMCFLVLK